MQTRTLSKIGLVGGLVIVAGLLVLIRMRAPKTISYQTIEIPLPPNRSGFDNLRINDLGVVAGTLQNENYTIKDHNDHVFLWDRDNGLTNLGNPGFVLHESWIRIDAINCTGQFFGETGPQEFIDKAGRKITDPSQYFFFDPKGGFWRIEGTKELRRRKFRRMNSRGQIFGDYQKLSASGEYVSQIFVWDPESGIRDLDLTGWVADINESGHILGWDRAGVFLWTKENGRTILRDIPPGPPFMFALHLNESDEVFGITERTENSNELWYYRWTQQEGYQPLHPIEKQYAVPNPIIAMDEQHILYYHLHKRFGWFGLIRPPKFDVQAQLFTVGQGMKRAKHLARIESYPDYIQNMNRNGWIVGVVKRKAYVMIPKTILRE